ncbi:hypothetical protein PR048_016013 [Dryococelus australis]|uniref:Mutator-like transposase domain-containing protein n=1 Tax=Dryococelus australis TaxID=614101 RepID=A0ABQ9HIJ1_9NEOP|nr:hypothetical protein PR048_016013 [Dryococelus australis]
MQAAGEEKAALAIQAGEVDDLEQKIILLFRFSCLQACIIDAKTKKVLFASTRNSYCCICDRASSKGESKNSHVCYKNWNKLSAAMEADIIVEGFRNSIDMHNLKYNK